MVVGLSHRIAMAESIQTLLVRIENLAVGLGMVLFHPNEQRRSEIVRDVLVVVHDIAHVSVSIEIPAEGIGSIAVVVYPLVPILIGFRGWLLGYDFDQGILPRRLVEVSVENQVGQCMYL